MRSKFGPSQGHATMFENTFFLQIARLYDVGSLQVIKSDMRYWPPVKNVLLNMCFCLNFSYYKLPPIYRSTTPGTSKVARLVN